MPDSNVRWLENQHTPLPKSLTTQYGKINYANPKQVLCRKNLSTAPDATTKT